MKFLIFLLFVIFCNNSYAYSNCTNIKKAFKLKALQSKLMIAALQCNQQDNYNEFINKFKSDLNDNNYKLKRYFKQKNKSFIRFNTKLANNISITSNNIPFNEFCKNNINLFKKLNKNNIYYLANKQKYSFLPKLNRCN